jgi:hypothetical protein
MEEGDREGCICVCGGFRRNIGYGEGILVKSRNKQQKKGEVQKKLFIIVSVLF